MHFITRGRLAAFTLCLMSTLAACSSDGGAKPCTLDPECPSGARCTGGTCVVNRPPTASIAVPAGVEAFAVVTLDGSASSDVDPGDTISRHEWRVTAVDAPCPGPIIAGTSSTAQARFGCAGRFAIELVAYDGLGAASSPALRELEVLPSTALPVVSAPADVPVGHRCGGDPLVCTLDTPDRQVLLAATAAEPRPRVRWTVSPPALPPGGARQVVFDPSPDVLAPAVTIETDGAAISGDWIFRVEAFDELGVLGAAEVRVSVTNNPPVIDAVTAPVPHTFDRAASRFSASGEIQVIGYDVDGDPIDRQVTWRAVDAGPAPFAVVDLGDRITFSIQVPYAVPADAAYLIGGAELERSITMVLRDSNGAEARETWPIDVENRPPVLIGLAPTVSVDHRFDASAPAYRADASLSAWSDPDGDPLFGEGSTGDLLCPDLTVGEDGVARVACALAYTGAPALANFTGAHSVRALVRDPWAPAEAATTTYLEILNRAPTALETRYSVAAGCSVGSCCIGYGSYCDEFYTNHAAATFPAEGFVADPDGDPLVVTNTVAEVVCEPSVCALEFHLAGDRVCSSATVVGSATFTASDGVETISAGIPVDVDCVW